MMWGGAFAGARHVPLLAGLLLLDNLAVTVKGAHSLRLLRSAYAGPCARVRRSSDNLELDIGFVAGAMSSTALTAHCGAGSGFVSVWYDQSGLGQNVAQATAANQPVIVSAGVVQTLGNATARPCMTLTKNVTLLVRPSFALGGDVFATACVASRTAQVGTYGRLISYTAAGAGSDGSNVPSANMAYSQFGSLQAERAGVKSFASMGLLPFQAVSRWDGTNHTMTVDETSGTPVASAGALAATGKLCFGSNDGKINNDEMWDGALSENIIVSGAFAAADRTAIRDSQKTYWGTP